jgi:hypothetical protein
MQNRYPNNYSIKNNEMKKGLLLIIFIMIIYFSGNAQKSCTITCNLTTANVCPTSNQWKNNTSIYNDKDLMRELGYVKDKNGCWNLQGGSTAVINGPKSKLQRWFEKLKGRFNVQKSGF